MRNLKTEFLLDPSIIFLNHGSYGACPRAVFDVYQDWQRQLEHQPVEFLSRRAPDLLAHAREELAIYLNVESDEVVYFPNPTTALNMVARNLDLKPGDEILTTNHEYGAMDRTWRFICKETGAKYIQQKVSLPVSTKGEFIEKLWDGVTPKTKIIFLSHISSPTALIFPVKEICELARSVGLVSIIDGAHAPGQIPLDLIEIGADVYSGACHKWMCAPKGAAFLYARREIQSMLDPLVVSWGYESEEPSLSQFIDYHEWQGTRDLAAFLSVPAAIRFQLDHDWESIRKDCHDLASWTREKLIDTIGGEAISPNSNKWFSQMFAACLPQGIDPDEFKTHLYQDYRIEALAHSWDGAPLIRVSFQAYNDQYDADALIIAIKNILN
jgi:isopenicillin-N epimerase